MKVGRLKPEFIDRTEDFADRCVAVAEQLDRDGRFPRIVEQLACSGSAVGANIAEADEAMSRPDFRKCMAIAAKELAETRFWIRLAVRRGWITEARVEPLAAELEELRKIVGSVLARTHPTRRAQPSRTQ